MVSSPPDQNSQGKTLPDSRRNWPGLAKRCSVFPGRAGATDERAFTRLLYSIFCCGERNMFNIGTFVWPSNFRGWRALAHSDRSFTEPATEKGISLWISL